MLFVSWEFNQKKFDFLVIFFSLTTISGKGLGALYNTYCAVLLKYNLTTNYLINDNKISYKHVPGQNFSICTKHTNIK